MFGNAILSREIYFKITFKLLIDEQQETIDEQQETIDQLREESSRKDKVIEELQRLLAEKA